MIPVPLRLMVVRECRDMLPRQPHRRLSDGLSIQTYTDLWFLRGFILVAASFSTFCHLLHLQVHISDENFASFKGLLDLRYTSTASPYSVHMFVEFDFDCSSNLAFPVWHASTSLSSIIPIEQPGLFSANLGEKAVLEPSFGTRYSFLALVLHLFILGLSLICLKPDIRTPSPHTYTNRRHAFSVSSRESRRTRKYELMRIASKLHRTA